MVALASGPLALLAVACAVPEVEPPPRHQVTATGSKQVKASPDPAGYAELVVDVWLRSHADDAGGAAAQTLHALAPGVELPLPASGERTVVDRVTAVRAQELGRGRWTVTVAAQYHQTPADDVDVAEELGDGDAVEEAVVEVPRLRYFAVPIRLEDAGSASQAARLVVATSPAVVPGPAGQAPQGAYDVEVTDGTPLAQTVDAFLRAYLAREGETERYVAPGVRLPAAGGFAQAGVVEVTADAEPPTNPSDGHAVRVLAQVEAGDDAGATWPLSYSLALAARDGRWEVTAVQDGPGWQPAPARPGGEGA